MYLCEHFSLFWLIVAKLCKGINHLNLHSNNGSWALCTLFHNITCQLGIKGGKTRERHRSDSFSDQFGFNYLFDAANWENVLFDSWAELYFYWESVFIGWLDYTATRLRTKSWKKYNKVKCHLLILKNVMFMCRRHYTDINLTLHLVYYTLEIEKFRGISFFKLLFYNKEAVRS